MTVAHSLEQVARAVHAADAAKAGVAVRDARTAVRAALAEASCASKEDLRQLDLELGTWEEKIAVILKEPAGREGMARHARHWVEKLGKCHG